MTVEELIEALKTQPPTATVYTAIIHHEMVKPITLLLDTSPRGDHLYILHGTQDGNDQDRNGDLW